ncbi:Protein of unknown function [Gryllus bimaculatus]|nr:Protein of unknown function [Gryllus bimaculatus]
MLPRTSSSAATTARGRRFLAAAENQAAARAGALTQTPRPAAHPPRPRPAAAAPAAPAARRPRAPPPSPAPPSCGRHSAPPAAPAARLRRIPPPPPPRRPRRPRRPAARRRPAAPCRPPPPPPPAAAPAAPGTPEWGGAHHAQCGRKSAIAQGASQCIAVVLALASRKDPTRFSKPIEIKVGKRREQEGGWEDGARPFCSGAPDQSGCRGSANTASGLNGAGAKRESSSGGASCSTCVTGSLGRQELVIPLHPVVSSGEGKDG